MLPHSVQSVYAMYGQTLRTDLITVWKDFRTSSPNLTADQAKLASESICPSGASREPDQSIANSDQVDHGRQFRRQAALRATINTDPTVAPAYALVQTDQTTVSSDQALYTTDLQAYVSDLQNSPTS